MTPTFTQRKGYQLIVNVFQSSVLTLFNDKDEYTYAEILSKTQIAKQKLDSGLVMMC